MTIYYLMLLILASRSRAVWEQLEMALLVFQSRHAIRLSLKIFVYAMWKEEEEDMVSKENEKKCLSSEIKY